MSLEAMLAGLYLVLQPLLCWLLGVVVLEAVRKWNPLARDGEAVDSNLIATLPSVALCFVLGLAAHLTLLFLFACLFSPLWLAGVLSWFPLALIAYLPIRRNIPKFELQSSFSAALFVTVTLALGVSLLDVRQGIHTPWSNGYADFAFHIGMLSSFVFSHNFPPEYHIFAGERLSYPFFTNLWAAELWSLNPSYAFLSNIFLFHFCLVTWAIYALLASTGCRLLPWALLFGGGSLFVLGENSGQQIPENIPWTLFLTTVWIPQRASLLGVALCSGALFVLSPLLRREGETKEPSTRLIVAALLFACAPLIHLHISLAVGIGVTLLLALRPLIQTSEEASKRAGIEFLVFVGVSALSIVWLPWLLGKSSIIDSNAGWVVGAAVEQLEGAQRLKASAQMWWYHAWVLPLGIVSLFFFRATRLLAACLLLLFLLGNVVNLSVWRWDQLKLFLGIYLFMLFAWSWIGERARYLQLISLVLVIPSAYELTDIMMKGQNFEIYSQRDIEVAERLREQSDATAVVATAPDHNAAATLSGRSLYAGYEGTLSSHKLDYRERIDTQRSLDRLESCEGESAERGVCPTHLVFDSRGRRYWRGSTPSDQRFESVAEAIYRLR